MTTIKRTSICLILLVFSTLNSSAQSVLQKQYRELQATLSDYEVVRLIPSDIEAQVKEGTAPLELNLKGETFRFRMEPRDLRSPRYRAEATGPDGVRRPLPLDEVTTYRGMTVSGQEVVQGRFTIDGDRFEGVVFTSGDWTFIESLQHFTSAARGDEWVVYRQSDIQPRPRLALRCVSPPAGGQGQAGGPRRRHRHNHDLHGGGGDGGRLRVCAVLGGAVRKRPTGKSGAILNQVEGVYETELKLKLEIVYQHAWPRSSDPYSGRTVANSWNSLRSIGKLISSRKTTTWPIFGLEEKTLTAEDEDTGEEKPIGGLARDGYGLLLPSFGL